jgi:hypothetical protein
MEHIPIPPNVAAAISAVMNEVPKLSKGEKNEHGNYKFASIDDFLEAVRPLCAKHGLIILQDEESFEMKEGTDKYGKPKVWLLMRFAFTLAHSSGETWAHRPTRSIMVDASMGSQAFGAAQSYVLKQFERSLFQIATGENDVDADSHPADNLPKANRAKVPDVGAPQKSKDPIAPWRGPLTKTDLQKQIRKLVSDIIACSDADELNACVASYQSVIDQCAIDAPEWHHGEAHDGFIPLQDRILQRTAELNPRAA